MRSPASVRSSARTAASPIRSAASRHGMCSAEAGFDGLKKEGPSRGNCQGRWWLGCNVGGRPPQVVRSYSLGQHDPAAAGYPVDNSYNLPIGEWLTPKVLPVSLHQQGILEVLTWHSGAASIALALVGFVALLSV